MKTAYKIILALAGIICAQAGHADTILRQKAYDLSQATDPTVFTLKSTQFLGMGVDADGQQQARLNFSAYKASFGRCLPTAEDWSPYNILCIRLTNREASPEDFKMLIYLTANASNSTNMFSGTLHLNPGESKRFLCYLNPDDAMPYGMEFLRPVLTAPYAKVFSTATTPRDLRTIYNWRISYQGTSPANVDVSDLRLIKQNMTFTGMVDPFGQYADRDWSDKVKSSSDFAARKAAELTDLAANPSLGEQLGSKTLVNEHPSPGAWKVVTQSSGMKYLQLPSGKLLWSLGVSAVHAGTPTPVQNRTSYFQSLPATNSTYGSLYTSRSTPDGTQNCYPFSEQNLMTKWGTTYTTSWTPHVKKRLASWGINTLGIQCFSSFYDTSIPYTIILSTSSFTKRLSVPYTTWGSMPDPFDPTFTSWMTTGFKATLNANNGRTTFMGVYVDNELAWGSTKTDARRCNLAMGTLKAPSTQAAKIAMVNGLTTKYGTVSALNVAWGTTFSTFSSILSAKWQPSTITPAIMTDFQDFGKTYAATYFSKVKSALKADGLTALYLGCRFADYTPELVQASEPYVDVHTFNAYRTADNVDWVFLGSLTKPVMFSEVGYGLQADGTFGGPAEVASEGQRSTNVRDFLQKASSQPNVVGVILYSYVDQPITGRYSDYENAGLGMVDVSDTPHYSFINVLRDFTKTMYLNRG